MKKEKQTLLFKNVNKPNESKIQISKIKKSESTSAPVIKSEIEKRNINNLSFFLKMESTISSPTIEPKFNLHHYLKKESIFSLVQECPNLKMAIQKIIIEVEIERNLLYGIIQRYLIGAKNLIWCDKYSPRNLKQSLNLQVCLKIQTWLRYFYLYRIHDCQDSNSLNINFSESKSLNQLKIIQEYNWKMKGLIVKGRSGVGKLSAIKVAAQQNGFELYLCGNDYNQIKYLKEKNEATQSESVKTKINKKEINKANNSHKNFAINQQHDKVQAQIKKIQYMHNVNNFYPKEEEIKFQNQLQKSIKSSKIPFIMTFSEQNITKNLEIYDVIEFKQAKDEELALTLFLIFHIQKSFSQVINFQKIVEKQSYKSCLNEFFKNFKFQITDSISKFVRLVEIFNKKLNMLLTYIQSCFRFQHQLDLINAKQIMKNYLKQSNSKKLLFDYYQNTQNKICRQYKSSSAFNINPSEQIRQNEIHKKQQKNDKHEDYNMQTSIIPSSLKQQIMINDGRQSVKTKINQSIKAQNQPIFRKIIEQLDLKVINDYSSSIQNEQCFIFNKCNNSQDSKLEEKMLQNILNKQHFKIRKNILKRIQKQYELSGEYIPSLKVKELEFVGLLIKQTLRQTRKSKNILDLKKLLKDNQIHYLNTFTTIIMPNKDQR